MFYDATRLGVTYEEIAGRAGGLPAPIFLGGSRLVVHLQTSEAAVDDFLTLVRTLVEEKRKEGFVPLDKNNVREGGPPKGIYVRQVAKINQ